MEQVLTAAFPAQPAGRAGIPGRERSILRFITCGSVDDGIYSV